ncbi:unnamed protein product [Paramecium octaurelia]|uniref:Uncharacterized protein n=1 Tax=Paramecium octaurelia TaxID=43137 RepID=A0A8S1YIR6_PAROT|nr:unnamed protein product [Paramecium octaurelia]
MIFNKDHIQDQFSFEPINSQNIYQSQDCKAIAINNSNDLILAACDKAVYLYQFFQDQMKQLQVVTIHQKLVTTLTICRLKTNYFSTSKDNSIKISSFHLASSSKYIQRLQEHEKPINCLALHPNQENIFVSGCDDGAIIFWKSNNNQWQKSQIINEYQNSYLGDIYGLSINPYSDEVISCTHRRWVIVITKQNNDSYWEIKQIISNGFGYRIGFITRDIFAFQLRSSSLWIYKRQQDESFQKLRELSVKGANQACDYYFPIIYRPQKRFFLSKNGHNLNFISVNKKVVNQEIQKQAKNQSEDDFDFELVQAIEIKQQYWGEIYGVVSDDGQYLISWSDSERQFVIRKYIDKQLLTENYV